MQTAPATQTETPEVTPEVTRETLDAHRSKIQTAKKLFMTSQMDEETIRAMFEAYVTDFKAYAKLKGLNVKPPHFRGAMRNRVF